MRLDSTGPVRHSHRFSFSSANITCLAAARRPARRDVPRDQAPHPCPLTVGYGFQFNDFPVLLSATDPAGLFCGRPAGAQRHPACGQSPLLCLGGDRLPAGDALLHRRQLPVRPAHRPGPATRPQGRAGLRLRGDHQPRPTRLLQVRQLPCRQPQPGPPDAGSRAHRHRQGPPAHRHLVLHLPGPELHHRPVPQRDHGAAEPAQLRPVQGALSPTDRRADRPLPRRGPRDRAAHSQPA